MTYLNALLSGYLHLFDIINLGHASQSTQVSPIRKLIRYTKPNLTCLQFPANQQRSRAYTFNYAFFLNDSTDTSIHMVSPFVSRAVKRGSLLLPQRKGLTQGFLR